jgi:hypothetical protein
MRVRCRRWLSRARWLGLARDIGGCGPRRRDLLTGDPAVERGRQLRHARLGLRQQSRNLIRWSVRTDWQSNFERTRLPLMGIRH